MVSQEPVQAQLTQNLFYSEGIRNQSFWMPPLVDVAKKLQTDMNAHADRESLILANTRIIHVTVWATGIPIRRFIHEMNKGHWEPNLTKISPEVRWVITEEGDQLWHAQGKFLQRNFIEVAPAETPSVSVVHLYRRPD